MAAHHVRPIAVAVQTTAEEESSTRADVLTTQPDVACVHVCDDDDSPITAVMDLSHKLQELVHAAPESSPSSLPSVIHRRCLLLVQLARDKVRAGAVWGSPGHVPGACVLRWGGGSWNHSSNSRMK